MKIRSRLQLSIILSLILIVTIGSFVFIALQEMGEEIEKARITNEIVRGIAELKIVTHEYLLHPTERSLMQWKSTYDNLTNRLKKEANEFISPAEKIALGKILRNITRFKATFDDLITGFGKEQRLAGQKNAIPSDLRDRLIGELLVKSQATVSPVFQLQQLIQTELVTEQQRTSLLIVIFLVILAALVTAISLWINNSITRPIAELEEGVQIIGIGNLDHKIGTTAKDEIGRLSRAFDKMTRNLKETTTSIVELNKEIDERKQAEEALRESEVRYRELVENAALGIFQVTREGKFLMINQRMATIFGYDSKQDFLANVDNIIELYANPEEKLGILRKIDEKTHVEGLTINFRWKNGNPIFCNAFGRSIQREDSEYIYEGLLEDITDKKKMEAQLQQTLKMEAIAILAGGVAHEFNNALMGILGNIELLKMDLPEDERRDKYFEAMKGSGHRMSRLTDQLLAYAEGGKYQPKNLKLDNFVIETLPILQHDLNPEVRVETHFQKVSYVKADNAQMQMVLSAILANSNEAIEDVGLIRITAENKDVDEDFTKQHPGLKPGYYVCLTIEDDGKGMDEETRSGIFEPFFTTKFQGRGMGMAAVYGIVKNHDGWISVDSELGKGTVVQIYLPAIEIEVEKPKKAKAEVTTGSGTILMIEDEDVVIEVTQAMLEMLGYRVMVAKTGKDAIHITETFDGQIDLALLDIKLPDMEGGKVYPLIMEARPNLKVIVFSGYAIEGPARKILDAGAEDFIQKPFSIATLSEKLKEVLEGQTSLSG